MADRNQETAASDVSDAAGALSPGMTRRSVMNAMTAIAAIPATCLAAPAFAGVTVDRRAWDKASARHERAKALVKQLEPKWEAGLARFHKLAPQIGAIRYDLFSPQADRLRIANAMDTAKARKDLASHGWSSWLVTRDPDQAEKALASVDAYRADRKLAKERSGYGELEHRYEAACEAQHAAWIALIKTPAPDGEALLWKMEELFSDDAAEDADDQFSANWNCQIVASVMSDARRLLSVGRA